ncbi:hypothetical protein [Oryza sativa Japonica Group]|uniref:Uncharacterized protein P0690B02.23 n=1 Tax=Oryza sativa subsp. japonica TaxID=39947 RepID=Q8W0D3_ORYSJ|nr:hypothetical protein [Oryza sativa Japonica Group]
MVNCCEGSCKSGISGRIARASGTCDNQAAAREDLAEVQDIIQQLELSSGMDQRIYSPNGHSETFSSSSLYQFLSSSNLPNCANWDFVWNNAALPRVQFFA